jgi:hypothetical protein
MSEIKIILMLLTLNCYPSRALEAAITPHNNRNNSPCTIHSNSNKGASNLAWVSTVKIPWPTNINDSLMAWCSNRLSNSSSSFHPNRSSNNSERPEA